MILFYTSSNLLCSTKIWDVFIEMDAMIIATTTQLITPTSLNNTASTRVEVPTFKFENLYTIELESAKIVWKEELLRWF
jgi:hypothetical protein